MIIADTSGLLAAMDADEKHHDACRQVVENQRTPVLLSPYVLAELDYLVNRKLGVAAELELLDDVALGAYQLAEMTAKDVAACRVILARYRDLGIGLAEASVVHLANRHRTGSILTLDERHFRALRTDAGQSFRLLPADA